MAFCSNCGHQLADGAKFCFECGVKVNQVHLDSSKEYVDTDENETQTRSECEKVNGGSSTTEFYEKDKSIREKYNYTTKRKRVIYKKILTIVCVLFLVGAILFGVISALGNGEKEYGTLDVTIKKNSQYSFGHNEWYLYTATAISDTLVKIEKWGKNFSTQKSFDYECDIGTFDITDGKYGFSWVDSSHTAFTFQLQDKSNGDFRKPKEIIFTVLATNSDTNKGTNIVGDIDYYVYKNDDWHQYKGVQLSDTSIKIECWYRAMALGSFHYGYDVCVINLDDIGDAFEWTDEEHTSFTVSLQDKVNSDLKKAKNVVFVIEK